jgi:4-aminobutyrate aminotransferase / (S)-3-amino-2-methylpropionate transaminase / 5-aminovalerate transaminase
VTNVETAQWVAGSKSREIFDEEQLHLAPGAQSFALFSQICIDHGEGALLFDVDANRFIDLMAGIGVASLGYAHPKYVAAMQKQIAKIHVGSFTSENRAVLVKMLADLAPGDINRTQLYSSGAEAVESALRLAKSYTGKNEVIGFWGGFHGKTAGVLPLLGSNFKFDLGPLAPGRYLSPYDPAHRCGFDKSHRDCDCDAIGFLKRKIQYETSNDIAAIIVEPIQGTAGNIVPRRGFMKALRQLCDEIGALLIADEMITGFGRTGKFWGIEHEGAIVPDIMTCGKGFGGGFPMSGLLVREKVAFAKPWANPSGSSSSYGGNPMAAAAARVTIETIQEEGLVENSRRIGEKMLAEVQRWEREIPIVKDARGRGLMIGFDIVEPGTDTLVDKKITRQIFDKCLGRGVLSMIYNPEVRINPPLVITEELAMEALAITEDILRETADSLAR